jgi:hypothetical protein
VPEQQPRFAHLWVRERAEDRQFQRRGGGDPKIRDVEARAHGTARQLELREALGKQDEARDQLEPSLEELRSLGVVVVLEGADASYPLRVDSLQRFSQHRKEPQRPQWLLLSVTSATTDSPERAMVWISDEYRARFLKLFEDYLARSTAAGRPRNSELVANIGQIRSAVLADLWQSAGSPPSRGRHWWELWLRPVPDALDALRRYVEIRGGRLAERTLSLPDRTVAWVEAEWDQLQELPFTHAPIAEIRRPEFIDTIEDLPQDEQAELAADLGQRVTPPDPDAPAVCHLDTGVRRTHVLLTAALAPEDVHSIVGDSGAPVRNHGTLMAGLALYGSLDDLVLGTATVALRHRLESVKFLPDRDPGHDPETYGLATAEAASLPEVTAPRRSRAFCMPITTEPDLPGQPTLWSASVDALAAGVDIGRSPAGIALLAAPKPGAARLFVISAGNVAPADFQADYRSACDNSPIQDPAQAWNALTVGAYTELTQTPSDPSFAGWTPLSTHGDISPHSRTSLFFGTRTWPIKPDICMEGGNVLANGAGDYHERHPLLCLRTTDLDNDLALGSANATSAATAQAARLAALVFATYPDYWPETIRGLITHAAEWTSTMRAEVGGAPGRTGKLMMLRRYGWGVPSEPDVLTSARNVVTLVTQDQFVPFQGPDFGMRVFRLHQLPWPDAVLRDLGSAEVTLRVTLSYFIEPTASRRGWRRRYAYPSHGLRLELKAPTEPLDDFVRRVNRQAQAEEEGDLPRVSGRPERWLIGPYQRNLGSLHQDIWDGTGADLAASGVLAVHAVGGWWKNTRRRDRANLRVRYALLVSLRTADQSVDLYTPVAVELRVPVETTVPGI